MKVNLSYFEFEDSFIGRSYSVFSFGSYLNEVKEMTPLLGIGPVMFTTMEPSYAGMMLVDIACEGVCDADIATVYDATESYSKDKINTTIAEYQITDNWKSF
jgi:hypothetical protein